MANEPWTPDEPLFGDGDGGDGSSRPGRGLRKLAEKIKTRIDAAREADQNSGAGFEVDRTLREYASLFNQRLVETGISLPQSFPIMRGFLDFIDVKGIKYLKIRSESDHLFATGDFIDFVTAQDVKHGAIDKLSSMREGLVHHYSATSDIRALAFVDGERRAVLSGVSLVRRGTDVHWLAVGGFIHDFVGGRGEPSAGDDFSPVESIREMNAGTADIGVIESMRAAPLQGYDDVWRHVAMGIFNLKTRSHEMRTVYRDMGSAYTAATDDIDYVKMVSERLDRLEEDREKEISRNLGEMARDRMLLELAETAFALPLYFGAKVALTVQTESPSRAAGSVERRQGPSSGFRRVSSLVVERPAGSTGERAFTPPSYRVELDGYRRRIGEHGVGKDMDGNPVVGWTWVKGHVRWKALPERPRKIAVKSSIVAAMGRAKAMAAEESEDSAGIEMRF
jgi:hypothetical protein